ncbi:glycosyltransferase family 2 protein [Cohnella lupini]|uniref:GT2 family glycosyltransferase n=1 Tax=Cohnella lupini TaxID=1294267 RepID=A0A3D9ITK6_9BACL|nr:glycosyltransferase family 2 protein [Cohnella lupini]RED65082.1 GT2 family glycosyltransferase [Cohnella lupini]
MASREGITLAICTRNRHDDLARCLRTVAAQKPDFPLEVLIVDDGDIPRKLLEEFSDMLESPSVKFRYYKKRSPGLLNSRIETLSEAKHDIILFIDDDVEMATGYLCRLSDIYAKFPDAAGIGGRDILLGTSFIWRLFCRIFLYGSGKPGKLSMSGYGGSMTTWVDMNEPFQTQYLAGCNMSFRKQALRDLQPAVWLIGYSVGEDHYLTHCARRHGPVWIDPGLTVIHHQSPLSRDKVEQVAYMDIVNHYYLLQEIGDQSWRHACLLWTAFGFLVRSLLRKKHRGKAFGYWRGIRFLLQSQSRRFTDGNVLEHRREQGKT